LSVNQNDSPCGLDRIAGENAIELLTVDPVGRF
jgi:hypothetical protein